MLGLTGTARPRVCFLPTASGDADHYIVRFYSAFRDRGRPTSAASAGSVESRQIRSHLLGALFEETELVETFTARDGAAVWDASLDGGGVAEKELHSRRLEDSRPPINDLGAEIVELRQTLAVRSARHRSRRRRPGWL